jgi:SP family facilitated glucose transporter-like MFS transporter 8
MVSGFMQDKYGRRRCMMGVTIPQLIGWVILYFSTSMTHLYIASIIMGLSIGFMEAPSMSYLGEVCEPRYRGTLSTFSETFLLLGILFEFFLGAVLYWRYACIASAIIPVVVFCIIFMVIHRIRPFCLLLNFFSQYEMNNREGCW